MILKTIIKLSVVLTLAGFNGVGCAPQRANALRDDKPLTVGLVGVSYRPNGRIGIGTTYSGSAETNEKMSESSSGASGIISISGKPAEKEPAFAERDVTSSYSVFSPFAHYYPIDTSAFFVGIGASIMSSRSKYNEETTGHTALAPEYTEIDVKRNATYLAVPVGWAWIWESGFSLSLDFGPRFRVSSSSSYGNDGSAGSVAVDKRDTTKEYLDNREPVMAVGGANTIIGWSF
jgi:hypothetical protein